MLKITKRQLRRIIREEKAKLTTESRVRAAVRKALVEGATIRLDTKEEVMAAIKGQDIELTMGGSGAAIVVQGGPTYSVNNAFEDIFASFDYDGDAVVRGLEAAARSVHVDDELKAEFGMEEQ